ncbi:MAG: alpha/beta hydrolase family protein, partial [Planctomycetia bacterium]
VDVKRLGCIGHSLGGHNTMFTAVFEPRLVAMVSCCGFTAFGKYYGGNLAGWSSDRYMPRIPSFGGWRNMPFDFHEVVAAFAPRPFLAIAPLKDSNFDDAGVREVMAAAKPVYDLLKAPDRLMLRQPDCTHDFPPPERAAAYAFFDRWLRTETPPSADLGA